MGKKIRTVSACRDCKKCTNSGFANLGRNSGRASAGIMTLGMSELVMAGMKKCRVCDHQLNLHQGAAAQTVQPAFQMASPAPQQPSGVWVFNPPPTWPQPPAGWSPPAGWVKPPEWPEPPYGWQLWVQR